MAGAWAFSVHMPGRLISHNFLILGSSQVQQMLLLPPLLNKVGREERNLSIVFFHWNQNKHCVCGILSNRKACAKSSFCVTQKQIRICPCIFNIMQMTFSSFLLRMPYSYSHSNMLIWISFKPFDSEHRIFWEHFDSFTYSNYLI